MLHHYLSGFPLNMPWERCSAPSTSAVVLAAPVSDENVGNERNGGGAFPNATMSSGSPWSLGETRRTGGILGLHAKWGRLRVKDPDRTRGGKKTPVTFKPPLIKVLTGICCWARPERQLYKTTSFRLFYYVTRMGKNLHCSLFKTATAWSTTCTRVYSVASCESVANHFSSRGSNECFL